MNVREFTPGDVTSVIEIAAGSSDAAQWSRESYSSLLEAGAQGWVTASGEAVLGFLLARRAGDELEILNLAVSAASRRKGIGSVLLREALSWASQNEVANVHLEVRASNDAARRFYESHGFRIAGQRPGYYSHPPDDAVLLFLHVAKK